MNPRLLRPTASGATHPDARDWATRVTANGGTFSSTTLAAVSKFCAAIDAAGIRDRFYRLNLFCGNSDASLNAVRTPLYRAPSLTGTQFGGTLDTNVNFVAGDYAETGASGGLTGDGTSKHLNTGFNADILPDTTQSGHLSVYSSGTYANQIAISAYQSTNVPVFTVLFTMEIQLLVAGNANTFINVSNNAATPSGTSPDFFLSSRTANNSLIGYRNGTPGTTQTGLASAAAPSLPFFVFARNFNGNPTVRFAQTLRSYSVGLGLTGSQVTAFNAAMQAFQAALGRGL
jgi:hypothetical protein